MSLDALMRRPLSARSLRMLVGGLAAGALLIIGTSIASRTWLPGFVLLALILVGLLAYATVRWPRPVIVLVVLSPILDRYVVAGLMPPRMATVTNNLSEGLLLGVGLILAIRAWRDGRLVEAFRYPSTVAFIAFIAVALVSALLNGVPANIAAIGLIFTIDAAACFYLPRLVGFSLRDALGAIGAIVAVIAVAAVIALAQALLSPTLFGLSPVAGRFGEVYRLASIFGDPNVFGAFLIAAVPFLLLAATRLSSRRLRWAAGAIVFIVMLALWLSFSRGSWVALIVGGGVILAILDRRALALGIAVVVVSFLTAVTMPRDLLVPRAGSGTVVPEERPNLVDSTVDRVNAVREGQDLRTLFALNALPILRDHPVIGVGPGRYGGAVANTYPTPIYREYRDERAVQGSDAAHHRQLLAAHPGGRGRGRLRRLPCRRHDPGAAHPAQRAPRHRLAPYRAWRHSCGHGGPRAQLRVDDAARGEQRGIPVLVPARCRLAAGADASP